VTDPDETLGARLRGLPIPGKAIDMTELLDRVARQADAEGLLDVAWTTTDTPIGPLMLAATPTGLVSINFGDETDRFTEDLADKVSPRVLRAPARLDPTRRQLDEYFAGDRRDFDLTLDWRLSKGFRNRILHDLVGVPYGHTVSYKDLAERAGSPGASRAVGSAMATNPIPIVVPCHRVLRTGGNLGGYGGGLETKVKLLALESGEAQLF
jgi:methylated-DNA-[protein]-cysteine S-methyltransferase